MVIFAGGTEGRVLINEFRDMALNDLFCADVQRPLDLVPLTESTHKYHPGYDQTFTDTGLFVTTARTLASDRYECGLERLLSRPHVQ